MKKTSILSFLLSLTVSSVFGQTLVAHTGFGSVSGNTSVTSSSINTTGANFLVVSVTWGFHSGSQTLSDNKSNTWTALAACGSTINSTTSNTQLFYAQNPTVGSGHTFTVSSSSSSYESVEVQAWSGMATSGVLDQSACNNSTSLSTGATLQPGSITPGSNGEVIVTAVSNNSTTADSINSSMTISDQKDFSGGNNYGSSMAYLVQATAAAINPTWTLGTQANAGTGAVAVASFLPTPPSGSGVTSLSPGSLSGNVTLAGAAGNSVSHSGQTITVTGPVLGTGTLALSTSSLAAAGTTGDCATTSATVTGVKGISATPTSDMATVSGYGPGGPLTVSWFVSTNTVNIEVCNNDPMSAHTPGALSFYYVAF